MHNSRPRGNTLSPTWRRSGWVRPKPRRVARIKDDTLTRPTRCGFVSPCYCSSHGPVTHQYVCALRKLRGQGFGGLTMPHPPLFGRSACRACEQGVYMAMMLCQHKSVPMSPFSLLCVRSHLRKILILTLHVCCSFKMHSMMYVDAQLRFSRLLTELPGRYPKPHRSSSDHCIRQSVVRKKQCTREHCWARLSAAWHWHCHSPTAGTAVDQSHARVRRGRRAHRLADLA